MALNKIVNLQIVHWLTGVVFKHKWGIRIGCSSCRHGRRLGNGLGQRHVYIFSLALLLLLSGIGGIWLNLEPVSDACYSLVQVLMMLLLCDQRLLLVMVMQLLF